MSELQPRPETPSDETAPADPPHADPPPADPPLADPPLADPPLVQTPFAGPPQPQVSYGYPPTHPYPYPYPYQVQPPFNTYAILAAVFAFVVFPPLGIYFGYKAREQIARTGERGSELATVGIVGGWIITGLQAAFLVVWCGLFFSFFASFATLAANTP